MSEDARNHQPRATNREEDEISLLDLAIVLAKHRRLVFGLPFISAVLAAIVSLLLPNIYTATTKVLPPQQNQASASAIATQLGGLAGLLGTGVRGNDTYIAMLKSRTVADNLIQRFGLMKRYDAEYPSQARARLEGAARVTSGKDGLITIEVVDKDPAHAAELANAYVDELFKFTNVLAVTEASQRRLFFERQFAQAKENLAKAEAAARQALERGGIVKVDDQGRAMVENIAQLRAQITAKEVQIGAMRTFATSGNPDLQLAQQELESMKRELAKIEGDGATKVLTNRTSNQGIDSLRLLRDVKYHETLYDLLARQYELARIDEAKDSAVMQVMDKAVVPDIKSGPKRRQIVFLSALTALLVAILWAFVWEGMIIAVSNPQRAEQLQILKRYLMWRW